MSGFKTRSLGSLGRRSRHPPENKTALTDHAQAEVPFIFPHAAEGGAPDADAASQRHRVGEVIKWQQRRSDTPEQPAESNYAVKPLKMSHISLFTLCWGAAVSHRCRSTAALKHSAGRKGKNCSAMEAPCFCLFYCITVS